MSETAAILGLVMTALAIAGVLWKMGNWIASQRAEKVAALAEAERVKRTSEMRELIGEARDATESAVKSTVNGEIRRLAASFEEKNKVTVATLEKLQVTVEANEQRAQDRHTASQVRFEAGNQKFAQADAERARLDKALTKLSDEFALP